METVAFTNKISLKITFTIKTTFSEQTNKKKQLFFLAAPHGMWDLSFPTRIKPVPPAVGAWSLNHWTTRELPRANKF